MPDSPIIDIGGLLIAQDDKRWRTKLLGRSSETTIGAAGCVVTAVAIAERALGHRAGSTPVDVMERGLRRPGVWAPGAAGAHVPELVRAQGLTVGADLDGPGKVAHTKDLKALILECLQAKGVALVCVDHDKDKPGGDEIGDHWGTIVEVDVANDVAAMVDPATCDVEPLIWRTLSGAVTWGKAQKTYRATRAITVFR